MKKIVELIADSKSTFVSKAAFGLLVTWLGFLFILRLFDLGMPESLTPISSVCETLLRYNVTSPNLNASEAESCPTMDYWNEIQLGHLDSSNRKIMLASYGKVNFGADSQVSKLLKNNRLEFTAVYNGTIYTKAVNQTARFRFASFKQEFKISCYRSESQCEPKPIMTFLPNVSAEYSIEYRIAYLSKEIKLNENYFTNLGAMTFNKNYIHMVFFSKLVNLLVTLAMFAFFWSGLKNLQKE